MGKFSDLPINQNNGFIKCVISSLDYNIVMMPHVKFGFVLFVILALTLMIFAGWFSFCIVSLVNSDMLSDWLQISDQSYKSIK